MLTIVLAFFSSGKTISPLVTTHTHKIKNWQLMLPIFNILERNYNIQTVGNYIMLLDSEYLYKLHK